MKTRFKRGLLCVLAAAVMLCGVPLTGSAAQFGSQGYNYLDVKKTPTGKTGENMTLNLVFSNDNKNGEDLHDVSIRFDDNVAKEEYDREVEGDEDSGSKGDIFPFEITSSTFNEKKIGTVKNGSSRNVSLTARVRRDIAEGYYTAPVIVRINGTDYQTERINIWITKSSPTSSDDTKEGTISFELGEGQPTPFGTYPNVMNFDINLRNASAVTAFDVDIKMGLDPDSAKFPFDINDGNYTRHFDRIGGGETVSVPYSMAIRKETYSGYYPITFTIYYKDSSDGDEQKEERTFYVKVQNKEKEEEETKEFNEHNSTKARIVVDSFETIPESVYAGQEFELILHLKNASEAITASNILFSLESEKVSDSAVFTTESGSSSIVVNSMGPGQTTQLRFRLQSKASVDQRSYSITINEKFDSPEFKNAEEKVAIDIPVRQEARLNTGTVDIMPDSITVGAESNVMFGINNTGKVSLYNVMVAFEADSIQKTDTYVGNIKPGETGNVDVMLSGIAPTMDDGKVKISITYEDENGVVSEPVVKDMTLTVMETMDTGDGMMDGEFGDGMMADADPAASKYQKYLVPGLAALVVLAAAAVLVIRKRKKKKKAAEEEAIIDDEIS